MAVSMRIGSEGFGINAGAQMRMGPVPVTSYPQPPETPKEEKPDTVEPSEKEVERDELWGDISPIVVGKLKNAGFNSAKDFAGKTKEELLEIDGIGEKVADQLLNFNS